MTEKIPLRACATLGTGSACFSQRGPDVLVEADFCVAALGNGPRGFHVHESGDTTLGCASMGAHYDPHEHGRHGGPASSVRHAGDLGNVISVAGCVKEVKMMPNVQLSDVVGRGLVVHAHEDDLGAGAGAAEEESKKTGNAGARLACGRIEPA